MNNVFSILMVSIFWKSPNKVKNILKGKREIKPTNHEANSYEYDFVMYERYDEKYYQFCIKTQCVPYLRINNGEYPQNERLYNVQDDLWIIKGDWDYNYKGFGYHKCPTINTPGEFEIRLFSDDYNIRTSIKVNVNPNINDFDFEIMKNDFEGEFWNLLTSKNSKLSVKKSELRYGDKVFRLAEVQVVIKFLKCFDIIAKTPKRELKYTTTLLPIEKIKPIPETFRKIAQYGLSKDLPSKSHFDHFDIYENRFVCLMLFKTVQIIETNINSMKIQIKRLRMRLNANKEKILKLEKPAKLNEQELLREGEYKRKQFDKIKNKWDTISKSLAIHAKGVQKKCELMVKYEDSQAFNYYWGKIDKIYSYFKLPGEFVDIFSLNESYVLKCNILRCEKDKKTANGDEYPFYFINSISKIYSNELIRARDVLKKHKSNFEKLRTNNFNQFSILGNANERNKVQRERHNQIEAIKRQNIKINHQIEDINKAYDEYLALLPVIKTKLRLPFCKAINYKSLTEFKPSMTFIQNANYRNIYHLYQKILKSKGLDIKVFGLYEQLSEYGIREMPTLYELWTLITTLSILSNSFHLGCDSAALRRLLEIITPNSRKPDKHVQIEFDKEINGRKIVLHYQKRLENNKRPDILLEIKTHRNKIFVVLDAKYKNYNYKLSATREVMNMQEKYNVQDNYHVFILHPCNDLDNIDYT